MALLRDDDGREHPVGRTTTLLGRDPGCDIVLRDDIVSRRHALITLTAGAYELEDLGSANGTFVNGQRVTQRLKLQPGDEITLGGHRLTFLAVPRFVSETPPSRATAETERPPSIVASLAVDAEGRVTVAAEAKLRAMLEVSRALGATLDLDHVLPKVLESLFVLFSQADSAAVLLIDPERGKLAPRAVHFRREPKPGDPGYSRTVVNHALSSGMAVLSDDAARDLRFDPSTSIRQLSLRSVMCVPLRSQDGANLGAIQVATEDPRRPFREEDLDVLISAASQAARAVELSRWHQERRDLEAATRIQKSFLPAERPRIEGLQFFDHYQAARYVGGDYYDYVPLPGDRLAVAVGDVAGKGVSAALLMARLSAAARFCLATEASPAEAVRRLNGQMARAIREDRFVTFVAALIDLKAWSTTLVNAGHLPPLLRRGRSGTIETIAEEAAGLPLGVFDRSYEEVTVRLEPGDTLVLFSDGVTEARNEAGELYGIDRLKAVITGDGANVEALGKSILADIQAFTAGRPPGDDLTIVCVGRAPEGPPKTVEERVS